LAEVVERVEKARATYLRWGRNALGWAIYMFRVRTPRHSSRTSMDWLETRPAVMQLAA